MNPAEAAIRWKVMLFIGEAYFCRQPVSLYIFHGPLICFHTSLPGKSIGVTLDKNAYGMKTGLYTIRQ